MSDNVTPRLVPRLIKATHPSTNTSNVPVTVTAFNYAGHTAHYFKGLSGAPSMVSDTDLTEPESGSDTDTTSDTSNRNQLKSTQHKLNAEVEEEIQVTAVVAQLVKTKKQKGTISTSKNSNKIIRVLLDLGSDGDLWFHQKGTPRCFSLLKRQMPKSWHTSGGNFRTKGQRKVKLNFQEYSSSKNYSLTPDVVEYDGKPVFDLIIGCKTMMELGIALDFKNKEITIDEIILPMRDINKLQGKTKLNRAWAVNNRLLHDPQSTSQETERSVKILDAKYEKAELPEVLKNNCAHLSAKDQQKLLELLLEFEELFDGTLGDWDTEPVSFQLQPGATPY